MITPIQAISRYGSALMGAIEATTKAIQEEEPTASDQDLAPIVLHVLGSLIAMIARPQEKGNGKEVTN